MSKDEIRRKLRAGFDAVIAAFFGRPTGYEDEVPYIDPDNKQETN